MAGSIHAVVLLLVPVLSALVWWKAPRRRPTGRQIFIAALVPILAAVFLGGLSHLCGAGNPTVQWFVPLVCMWALTTYLARPVPRRVGAALLLLSAVLLSEHYDSLVHGDHWTGNRSWPESVFSKVRRAYMSSISSRLKDLDAVQPGTFEAGWVRDLPLGGGFDPPRTKAAAQVVTELAWHSAFTRLYATRLISIDYWYPGGRPADAADDIEIRDRRRGE